jgi:carbonic anhydrase/acetyltransferase-like protein (isoleucine patch superfamily)
MRREGIATVSETAVVEGDVRLGAEASVWHHAVIRGDVAPIRVGERTSVQDGAILHCRSGVPLEIASDVVIGHRAVVHCRRVGSRTLIGIGALVLDDSELGADCIVAAGAVVPPGTIVPDGTVLMGMPARPARSIRPEERRYILDVVARYVELARRHAAGELPEPAGG